MTDFPGLSYENEQIIHDLMFVNKDSDIENEDELLSGFKDILFLLKLRLIQKTKC